MLNKNWLPSPQPVVTINSISFSLVSYFVDGYGGGGDYGSSTIPLCGAFIVPARATYKINISCSFIRYS